MSRKDQAPLEQVFKGSKARVLDHLATMMPFDFSPSELSKILKINVSEIENILEHLENYELIEFTKNKRYAIADNTRTLSLRKFIHEVACWNLDKIIAKQDKEAKPDNNSPRREARCL